MLGEFVATLGLKTDVLDLGFEQLGLEFLVFNFHLVGFESFTAVTNLFLDLIELLEYALDVSRDPLDVAVNFFILILDLFALLDGLSKRSFLQLGAEL